MRQFLKLHPGSRSFAAATIEVEVARPRSDSLVLSYIVIGKMSDLRMPPVIPAARSDELWRHTCFEAFLRASSGPEYYEFNFAPSTQWAAYQFSSYRGGMRAAVHRGEHRIQDCILVEQRADLEHAGGHRQHGEQRAARVEEDVAEDLAPAWSDHETT